MKRSDFPRIAELPRTVCFRVTRFCNARCGFCLAPPDGSHPAADVLMKRIDWLLDHGVKVIHFCGGEPTIHSALADLLGYVGTKAGSSLLTTNGIEMSDNLLEALRTAGTQVKVSLHGDREHHNAVVGCDAFDRTTKNLRRLLAAEIPTSIQTTIVKNAEWVVPWAVSFCLKNHIRRLSILPFIPRGTGAARRADYELSPSARRQLRERVADSRRSFSGRLEIRWLDFAVRPVPAVEADGRVILEGATETMDRMLYRIP